MPKPVAVLIILLLTTTGLFAFCANWAYDDPFITYRYARNLAQGLGFVYNPGENVLSTTTPLFTLLLASLSFVWGDLPRLAVLLGCLSLGAGALFLWDLSNQWKAPFAGYTVLLLYPTFPLLVATLGSEIPLYLAFCLAALALYGRSRLNLAAGCAALATLTRPDGFLIAVILTAHFFFHSRAHPEKSLSTKPWKAGLVFLALLLPWVVYAWLNFGSPLPVTLAAKQQQALMQISQSFPAGFATTFKPYTRHWPYWVEAAFAMLGFSWVLYRLALRKKGSPAPAVLIEANSPVLLLAWSGLYFFAYSALGVSRYFWYYAALVPAFLAMAGVGINLSLEFLIAFLDARRQRADPRPMIKMSPKAPRSLAIVIWAILVLPLAAYQLNGVWRVQRQPERRITVYQMIGNWLEQNTPPGASVASLEVGAIGYYAQRPMLDFAGLIQPEVAKQFSAETSYEEAALWAVEKYQPEYLALGQNDFPLLEQRLQQAGCQIVQQFPGWKPDQTWNIFACGNSLH